MGQAEGALEVSDRDPGSRREAGGLDRAGAAPGGRSPFQAAGKSDPARPLPGRRQPAVEILPAQQRGSEVGPEPERPFPARCGGVAEAVPGEAARSDSVALSQSGRDRIHAESLAPEPERGLDGLDRNVGQGDRGGAQLGGDLGVVPVAVHFPRKARLSDGVSDVPEGSQGTQVGGEAEAQTDGPLAGKPPRGLHLHSGPAPGGIGDLYRGASKQPCGAQGAGADAVEISRQGEAPGGQAEPSVGFLGPARIPGELALEVEVTAKADGRGREGIQGD